MRELMPEESVPVLVSVRPSPVTANDQISAETTGALNKIKSLIRVRTVPISIVFIKILLVYFLVAGLCPRVKPSPSRDFSRWCVRIFGETRLLIPSRRLKTGSDKMCALYEGIAAQCDIYKAIDSIG